MNRFLRAAVTVVALALMSVIWPPSLKAGPCDCPTDKDVISSPADTIADVTNPAAPHFVERARAATVLNACEAVSKPTPDPTTMNVHDFGEGFDVRLLGLLAYPDFCPGNTPNGVDPVGKANDLIKVLVTFKQAHPEWVLGTTVDPAEGFGGALKNFLTNFEPREGEFDVDQNALTAVLHKYGPSGKNRIQPDVYDQALSIMDLNRNLGLSYSLSVAGVATICATVCLPSFGTPAYLVCLGVCSAALASAEATVDETENHLNNTWISQFLANELLWEQSCDAGSCNTSYDNSRNGMRTLLLNRMAGFLQKDFIEYNSHNYQDYTFTSILNLYTNARDPAVQNAAGNVLDYISAKVAVSSNGICLPGEA